MSPIYKNPSKIPFQSRIMIGVPMTGVVRSEWMMARYGQTIPCNWSHVEMFQWIDQYSPIGYLVADARNIIATIAVERDFRWLLFIDHDVILPKNTFVCLNQYMQSEDIPVLSGLYFCKSVPAEPLVYRGRGTSYYGNWKIGDKVWVDGIPMGVTLIHGSILKAIYDVSPTYLVGDTKARKIFQTPVETKYNVQTGEWGTIGGTEDLYFCSRVMNEGLFEKAGWPKFQKKKYPFLIDTGIFCLHIDWTGTQYPFCGEEQAYIRK